MKQRDKATCLIREIKSGQSRFFGHAMRRNKHEHLVTSGKLEWKRTRRRH